MAIISLCSGYISRHYEILLYSPFLVVDILVGMLGHLFCDGRNGGYDELSSPHVILFQLHGNILYGKAHILVGIRSVYVMWFSFLARVLVGTMIHVIGGGCISGYNE